MGWSDPPDIVPASCALCGAPVEDPHRPGCPYAPPPAPPPPVPIIVPPPETKKEPVAQEPRYPARILPQLELELVSAPDVRTELPDPYERPELEKPRELQLPTLDMLLADRPPAVLSYEALEQDASQRILSVIAVATKRQLKARLPTYWGGPRTCLEQARIVAAYLDDEPRSWYPSPQGYPDREQIMSCALNDLPGISMHCFGLAIDFLLLGNDEMDPQWHELLVQSGWHDDAYSQDHFECTESSAYPLAEAFAERNLSIANRWCDALTRAIKLKDKHHASLFLFKDYTTVFGSPSVTWEQLRAALAYTDEVAASWQRERAELERLQHEHNEAVDELNDLAERLNTAAHPEREPEYESWRSQAHQLRLDADALTARAVRHREAMKGLSAYHKSNDLDLLSRYKQERDEVHSFTRGDLSNYKKTQEIATELLRLDAELGELLKELERGVEKLRTGSVEFADIEELGLSPRALMGAKILRALHPQLQFIDGRRDTHGQARAIAANLVEAGTRSLAELNYRETPARAILQRWIDDHPKNTSVSDLAAGLQVVFDEHMTEEQRATASKHLTGDAFDLKPAFLESEQIKADISALPGVSGFLDHEGKLLRWHVQF